MERLLDAFSTKEWKEATSSVTSIDRHVAVGTNMDATKSCLRQWIVLSVPSTASSKVLNFQVAMMHLVNNNPNQRKLFLFDSNARVTSASTTATATATRSAQPPRWHVMIWIPVPIVFQRKKLSSWWLVPTDFMPTVKPKSGRRTH